jgi:mannose-6-phosphate isomerase
MTSVASVFALIPTTQSYDWGKAGSDSEVARLATASNLPGFELDTNARYAEVSNRAPHTGSVVTLGVALDGDAP